MFPPSEKSEAGYRLYDDKALETLQQILFFREFDIPLKEIKTVLENPSLDRSRILRMQREMLMEKKERMERLIASVDDALKGDERMDFTVFTKTEIEMMFQLMFDSMTEEMRQAVIGDFGSVEQWKTHLTRNSHQRKSGSFPGSWCNPTSYHAREAVGDRSALFNEIYMAEVIRPEPGAHFVAAANCFHSEAMKEYRTPPAVDSWRAEERYETAWNALAEHDGAYCWISARMFCPANTASSANTAGKQTQIPSGQRSTT